MKESKKYIIWFIIWLLSVWTLTYAADSGSIGALFENISWSWFLKWENIKDNSIAKEKLIDWIIPTKISELENDSWYLTWTSLKTKDFFCRWVWYMQDGELFCWEPLSSQTIIWNWTNSSWDCWPDSWSNTQTVSCPSGYSIYDTKIKRQARWRSSNSWAYDTWFVSNTSNWNARTTINCNSNSCTYSTKWISRIDSYPAWGVASCGWSQRYTRLMMEIECKSGEFKVNY
jgi:hypothetical protein